MSNGDYSTISSSKAKPKEKQIDEQQQKRKKRRNTYVTFNVMSTHKSS
jgi:hypothetical protein